VVNSGVVGKRANAYETRKAYIGLADSKVVEILVYFHQFRRNSQPKIAKITKTTYFGSLKSLEVINTP